MAKATATITIGHGHNHDHGYGYGRATAKTTAKATVTPRQRPGSPQSFVDARQLASTAIVFYSFYTCWRAIVWVTLVLMRRTHQQFRVDVQGILPKLYSWIALQEYSEKKNCQRTKCATTMPRSPLESSWRGEFRSARIFFVKFIFTSFSK